MDQEKYKVYKEWCARVRGKLPYMWRQQIIKKHFSGEGEVFKKKKYFSLLNTYNGNNNNLLNVKYITEIMESHKEGKDYLKI